MCSQAGPSSAAGGGIPSSRSRGVYRPRAGRSSRAAARAQGPRRAPGRSAVFPHGAHVRPERPRRGRDRAPARRRAVTPPPAIRRRASLREATPRASARRAGRWTAPGGHDDLGHVLRDAVVADDAVEVVLGPLARRPAPWKRSAISRPRRRLSSPGWPGRRRRAGRQEPVPLREQRASGMLMVRPNCSSGGVGDADLVAERLAHLLLAVEPGEDRHRHHDLRRLAVVALDVAGEHQVEELVGAAELDVGLDHAPSRRPASAGRAARARRSAGRRRCARRSRCAAGAG